MLKIEKREDIVIWCAGNLTDDELKLIKKLRKIPSNSDKSEYKGKVFIYDHKMSVEYPFDNIKDASIFLGKSIKVVESAIRRNSRITRYYSVRDSEFTEFKRTECIV